MLSYEVHTKTAVPVRSPQLIPGVSLSSPDLTPAPPCRLCSWRPPVGAAFSLPDSAVPCPGSLGPNCQHCGLRSRGIQHCPRPSHPLGFHSTHSTLRASAAIPTSEGSHCKLTKPTLLIFHPRGQNHSWLGAQATWGRVSRVLSIAPPNFNFMTMSLQTLHLFLGAKNRNA